jgi:hypothetical protein
LVSVLPAISPKIWTSIFTGKRHEKTGIDFFGGNSRMVKCKRLWDIFSGNGLKVGIFGSFVTWPPYEINGFMIPAIDSLGTETYPSEYEFFQEIALNERKRTKRITSRSLTVVDLLRYAYKLKTKGVRYRTFFGILSYLLQQNTRRLDPKDKYWRKLVLHSEISTDVFIELCHLYEPDFATIHIHLCDSVSHRYWMAYEPDKFAGIDNKVVDKYKDVIPEAYMQADRAIGRILDSTTGEVNIIVVSDHGFKAISGGMDPYDINIEKLLAVLGIREKVIVARFGPGMYLNFRDQALMHHVAEVVSKTNLRETGEKIFNVRVFENTLIITKPNWKVDTEKLRKTVSHVDFGKYGVHPMDELYTRQGTKMSGVHKKEGIIILSGPRIRHGIRLEPASIYDVTPTVLHLMGFAVARDMDGQVLLEALDEEYLKKNPIRFIDTYEDSATDEIPQEEIEHEIIEKRLRSLGYL